MNNNTKEKNAASQALLQAFLQSKTDCYAVLQLQETEDTVRLLFSSMKELERMGLEPEADNYETVCVGLLPDSGEEEPLENIYAESYRGGPYGRDRGISVSDVIVLKEKGRISCHYVDAFGFRELPGFLPLIPD